MGLRIHFGAPPQIQYGAPHSFWGSAPGPGSFLLAQKSNQKRAPWKISGRSLWSASGKLIQTRPFGLKHELIFNPPVSFIHLKFSNGGESPRIRKYRKKPSKALKGLAGLGLNGFQGSQTLLLWICKVAASADRKGTVSPAKGTVSPRMM